MIVCVMNSEKEIVMKASYLPKLLRKGAGRNSIENENGEEVARIAMLDANDNVNAELRDEIVICYNAPEMVAEVEVRNVYGNEMIYPANFAAERFAAIAGKKTLSRSDLENIKRLGFSIEEVATRKLAA